MSLTRSGSARRWSISATLLPKPMFVAQGTHNSLVAGSNPAGPTLNVFRHYHLMVSFFLFYFQNCLLTFVISLAILKSRAVRIDFEIISLNASSEFIVEAIDFSNSKFTLFEL